MKGVILAGGTGTRLRPLTLVTNKQLLPIYNRPLIYYPLNVLVKAGITDILLITSPTHVGHYVTLFESGKKFGIKMTYAIQESPDGLAHALSLAEDFADDEPTTMILGDNIITDDISEVIKNFDGKGAVNFFVKVPNPQRFGCPVFNEEGKLIALEEKPEKPKSDYAQIGLYIHDNTSFDKIRTMKPSARGELEITDLNNLYLKDGDLDYKILDGDWFDTGTHESLFEATVWAKKAQEKDKGFFVFE